jgi:chemotaxis protein MotB
LAKLRRRRRRQEDESQHTDRWLVSYADFITLLFAFFVVMYAISQVNEGKYRLLSDSLVQAFKPDSASPEHSPDQRASAGHSDAVQATARMKEIAHELVSALGDLVNTGQVRITESGLGIAVEINASVLFDSARAELTPQAFPVLQQLARVLAPLPNDLQVEGHTDNAPISTPQFPSNWELSAARASSVVRLFIDEGIAPVRLVAVGYADTRNVVPNSTAEERVRNRRVTVMILPEHAPNRASVPTTAPAAQ